jgi:hypothetical protein
MQNQPSLRVVDWPDRYRMEPDAVPDPVRGLLTPRLSPLW